MQHSLTGMHCLAYTGYTASFFTSLHHLSQWELPNVVTDLMLMGRLYLLACNST